MIGLHDPPRKRPTITTQDDTATHYLHSRRTDHLGRQNRPIRLAHIQPFKRDLRARPPRRSRPSARPIKVDSSAGGRPEPPRSERAAPTKLEPEATSPRVPWDFSSDLTQCRSGSYGAAAAEATEQQRRVRT